MFARSDASTRAHVEAVQGPAAVAATAEKTAGHLNEPSGSGQPVEAALIDASVRASAHEEGPGRCAVPTPRPGPLLP